MWAKYVILLAVLAAAIGAIFWLLRDNPPVEPVGKAEGSGTAVTPQPAAQSRVLQVTVTADRRPARGKVAVWTQGERLPFGGVLPVTGEDGAQLATGKVTDFQGTAQLEWPAAATGWIRFDAADGSMGLLHVKGPADPVLRVQLGHEPSNVYVMVLGPDWHTPASASIRATLNPEDGGQRRDLGTFRPTGGELTIPGVAPGTVVLRPETFRRGDDVPFVATVTVGNRGLRRDACAMLIVPDARQEVTVNALVQELPAGAPATKLVLQRMDRPESVLLWSGQPLFSGEQKIPFVLWAGDWQPSVIPAGELTISGADLLAVHGNGPHEFAMHFAPCAARTELTLTGIEPAHLPVRILAQSADSLADDDPERYFGPPQWAAPKASVPAVPGAVWLVAIGRGANYVGTAPCTLAPPAVTVPMQKACMLTIARGGWDPAERPEVMAVTAGDLNRAATMRPRVVREGGVARLVLAASLAMPLGKVTVGDREVALTAPAQTVEAPTRHH